MLMKRRRYQEGAIALEEIGFYFGPTLSHEGLISVATIFDGMDHQITEYFRKKGAKEHSKTASGRASGPVR